MILPRSSAIALAIVLVAPAALADEPPAPPRGLELSIGTHPTGPWTMVLANKGTTPLRVAADARLLTLEVIGAPEPPPAADAKRPARAPAVRAYPRGSLPVCKMPPEMRPGEVVPDRALVLKPGETYTEKFDLVAVCGAGKVAAEVGPGAIVYPTFGWPLHGRPAHGKKATPPPPPYVAESLKLTEQPPPARAIEAAGIMLPAIEAASGGKEVATKEASPDDARAPVDEHAPRLVLRAAPLADAHEAGDVAIAVTLSNAGKRKTMVHLRADDLDVRVVTPGGATVRCNGGSDRRAVSREFFDSIGPGDRRTLSVQLREHCPGGTFDRPGGYLLEPTLVLRERGEAWGLSAFVGKIASATPTRLRVRTGRLPYHATPPRADATTATPDSSAE